ncbi:MAG: FAD-dependent oxidoreductase [Armatimonadetes bacterium]|nr:FAD-dependent oxidoreductase [Armatimonadota bacterium]
MSLLNFHDIIIIGGGMAGCAAAASAARSGRKTLLIERFGYLGGWATAGLVNPFMTHLTSDGEPLISGLFDEIRQRLMSAGGLLGNSFDPEVMMYELQEMVLESGARLRLHTTLAGAALSDDGGIIVRTMSKSGPEEFTCRCLIDCSGDGDAAASLGAQFEMGDENNLPQAATLMFDVGGVDLERSLEYVREHPDQIRFPKLTPDANLAEIARGVVSVAGYYDLVRQGREAGDYGAPGEMIFYISRPRKGEVVFNTTHIGSVNGTNAEDLTRAEIESRRQMMSVVKFVRKYVPGFENAYLLRSAAHVGIRETRRIIGDYVFSARDVIEARKFDDAICRLAYPVDVHSGKGEGYTKDEELVTGPQKPPPGDWYEIPYRCLLPVGLENVLVAGRCVSSTQAGHGAIRIMPACAAMGEAAGVAASLAIASGTTPRSVDRNALLSELRSRGALV